MATIERIIPPHIAEDGSVHYSSVMSPPDDSIAVCYMVPDRIIPVIFVPGVMGTNLKSSKTGKPVWLVDGVISVIKDWGGRDAVKRKLVLDPANTGVSNKGEIPTGTAQSEAELRRRGWGEVANMSYGTFLSWLENALNDAHECKTGHRAELMQTLVTDRPGGEP